MCFTSSQEFQCKQFQLSGLQVEQLQSQCCQLEKELARKQGDAEVFKREAENKLAERMRVALREQQLEYESQVRHQSLTRLMLRG